MLRTKYNSGYACKHTDMNEDRLRIGATKYLCYLAGSVALKQLELRNYFATHHQRTISVIWL